ncbi:MAG: ATP-binding cassette domain-containing protein [Actinobacteria bacterium]|nr:ATP-binding cassette domain-containing protein [Actinomycetota bacterium]
MNSAISIKNITKTLGSREILNGISFDVELQDIFGYLGPNGAGKTTTIRILLGLFQADSGKLEILGKDINLSETRKKIGFIIYKNLLLDPLCINKICAGIIYLKLVMHLPKRMNLK